ncbi:S-ribosylhomocysteine lyase [uncultured Dysosmobacter sp.]|uniref:S-ribosylhomocysteine lyase n=1 Tax=uncultured Dysosmobacter sp. TaxID=2591384 RepID=UPI00262255EC|nr:S-ribosylhomocysteine lyase [uncultured Dysosmobacter sp.]
MQRKYRRNSEIDRIASFIADHNRLIPGRHLSRRNGDSAAFGLQFKKLNTGDLPGSAGMHSAGHLIAALLRNSFSKEAVIYFSPMGGQTGFGFPCFAAGGISLFSIAFCPSLEQAGAKIMYVRFTAFPGS